MILVLVIALIVLAALLAVLALVIVPAKFNLCAGAVLALAAAVGLNLARVHHGG